MFGSSHTGVKSVQTEQEAFWYLHLNAEQEQAYEAFRAHLKEADALCSTHEDRLILLRFLKARQWDVTKATAMYTDMIKWRQERDVDALHSTFDFPEADKVFELYPHFFHKTDKYGRPLYIELCGQSDPAKLLDVTTMERLMDYHVTEWERLERQMLPACSQAAGKPIVTKSVILDLKGVSMKNFGMTAQKMLKTIAKVDQDYYPEHLGQMFIINTPMIFRAIWAVVNPLLEDRTRRKIVILGADYLQTVLQLVPEDNLPTILGGKSVVKDMKVSTGPWSDVSYMPKASSYKGVSAEATADILEARALSA